ncbi:MAG: phosphatase PAP2 family protein [Acidobacteriia bacterium]|nr:phosphatase PAP2 family protein [Terriglobia bacterium]
MSKHAHRREGGWVLVGTLALAVFADSLARGQEAALTDEFGEANNDASANLVRERQGAQGSAGNRDEDTKLWPKHLAEDERDLWMSPTRIRAHDTKWMLLLGGSAAGLMAADHAMMQQNKLSGVNVRRSADFSNYGVEALVGAGAGLYLWGKMRGDEHKTETGLMSGEAALNAFAVTSALQRILGRERPGVDQARGRFFRGGSSFPSDHSAVAWSIASVIAHQYPGPLTKFFAYGLAGATSVSRVAGNKHFPSDVLVGGALGWLVAREIYRKHSEPDLGAEPPGGSPGDATWNEGRNPNTLASPFVQLDSWVYPALERLAALGYIRTGFLGTRPWTRKECARLVEEAGEIIREEESKTTEANRLYNALEREFPPDVDPPGAEHSRGVRLESLYTRMLGISGQPLRDSYHFGQTLINDFGRPYAEGFNPVSGFSGWANWGRFAVYMRGEYQHSPFVPAYSQDIRSLIAQLDGTPVQPAQPQPTINQFRLLDTYALTTFGNWDFSFGKQSLWWGPNRGGSLLLSNNAEPIYMFRASRSTPFTLPGMLQRLGPLKVEAFFGQLAGNQFPPRPFFHGERISVKPTENLELGFSRTAEFGGVGRPLTWGSLFNTYFSVRSSVLYPAWNNPGQRNGGFDFSYRVPWVRNWLTLYGTAMTRDDPTPLMAFTPLRALINPGVYLSHIPHFPRLDFRAEGVTTIPPAAQNHTGHFTYWESFYRDNYTNKNYLIGDWIGRAGTGYQAWSTYWFNPRTSLQFGYRHAQVSGAYIPHGGTLNDASLRMDWQIGNALSFSAFVQYEKWLMPVLAPEAQNNVTTALQMTFWPRQWSLRK